MPNEMAKQSVLSLSFNATDLDTDDEREWDQICDAVEATMREAKGEILHGIARSAKVIITVAANSFASVDPSSIPPFQSASPIPTVGSASGH